MKMQYLSFGICAKYINKYMSKTRDTTNWDLIAYSPHLIAVDVPSWNI